ncbi:MAG: AAA family ATPase, partial [Devosia sp.]
IFLDGDVIGGPEQFGHGLQRTYIMALLNVAARAQAGSENANFAVLLGVEEPELYQHPPQARFLASALYELAGSGSQVIVTTHSPYFISGRTFESVRVLRRQDGNTKVYRWSVDEQRKYCATRKNVSPIGGQATLSGIDRSLQTNIAEMFFASKVVFVEGAEDEAIISTYLRETKRYEAFLAGGGHIVPVGGKTKMPVLLALARGFWIDAFCIFDFDSNVKAADQKNDDLIRYAQDVPISIPTGIATDFSSSRFFAFRNNIQDSILATYPVWESMKSDIAVEWGWDLSRMEKDPMLLSEAVGRLFEQVGHVEPLEAVATVLMTFCE